MFPTPTWRREAEPAEKGRESSKALVRGVDMRSGFVIKGRSARAKAGTLQPVACTPGLGRTRGRHLSIKSGPTGVFSLRGQLIEDVSARPRTAAPGEVLHNPEAPVSATLYAGN